MRENNRKPIEKCRRKLPQFTTMNVIDGQAGLVIYSSLIFYSLTIDNILNIIVLLILAGISISMLTGDNGILTQAQRAKEKTEEAQKEEENILSDYEDYLNRVTGDVPEVDDSNPGELEGSGTEKEPYTINSIEDLVSFADSVTNGNTYEGEYVKLNQSLDFKSDKSYVNPNRENYYGYAGKLKEALTTGEGFKPIGMTIEKSDISDTSNSFCGYFDGNGKQIMNCYMNKELSELETDDFGFFGGYLYGEVKNFGLIEVDYNLNSKSKFSTGISGFVSYLAGKLDNCYVTGNIDITQGENSNTYCTGLVIVNRGTIENCYNSANLKATITAENYNMNPYCAGIASNCEYESSIVRNCYNYGNIQLIQNYGYGSAEIGGIVRYQGAGIIENCYNSGNIEYIKETGESWSSIVGGIIGEQTGGTVRNVYNKGNINVSTKEQQREIKVGGISGILGGNLDGAYNIGTITYKSQSTNCFVGELFGDVLESAVSYNSFYINNEPVGENLSSSCVTTKITSEQLKSNEILNLLNSDEIVWKKDTSNINNGYPILSWQK